VAVEHLLGFESRFFPDDDLAARVERTGFTTTVLDRGFGYTVVGLAGERTSQVGAGPDGG
jgi:hypothetical protein